MQPFVVRAAATVALVLAGGFIALDSAHDARAEAKRPHFTDVAGKSNFTYISNNDFRGRKYFPQPMCGGIAAFDFDNDGNVDLFFTNGAKLPELKKTDASFNNCLLRNHSDGTFEDVTAKAALAGENLSFSFGVAAGDYDNDGFVDLFVCNAGKNTLYHNNGDGTFTDVTDLSGIGAKPNDVLSVAAAWFDYDNDGLLIVSNYTTWTPDKDVRCQHNGSDYFAIPRYTRPCRTACITTWGTANLRM